MELVSIVVVNFNSEKWLQTCLDSIFKQTYPQLEVILVDNASTDGSLSFLKKNFSQLPLIGNKENVGFAKAVNQGIAQAKGEFILPLNPDVGLTPHYVEEMLKAANKNGKIGSVSGKLYRSDEMDSKVIDSAGHLMFKNRLSANRGNEEIDKGQYNDQAYVFGTCGAAALYNREMLDDIKINGEYFDETFFAFWEDIDLDWRANLRGWKCLYTPEAVAYHYRGGIRTPRPKLIEFNNYRNRYLALIKNDSFWGLLKSMPQIIFTDIFKSGALLFRCPAALLAWLDVFGLLPEMLAKRRIIQNRKTVSFKEMDKWFQKFDYLSWFKRHLI